MQEPWAAVSLWKFDRSDGGERGQTESHPTHLDFAMREGKDMQVKSKGKDVTVILLQ